MSSIHTIDNQTMSLAGILQSVHLCKSLATTGTCDEDDLAATLRSILTLKSDRFIDAYGGNTQGIKKGLRVLKNQLMNSDEVRDIDVWRYGLSLMQLGTNVLQDQHTVEQLRIGISQVQSMESPITDGDTVSALASIYSDNISKLTPRIMINGDQRHLGDTVVAAKIRAALLGGVRSVVLWRQCGGSRPKLLMQRGRYLDSIDSLLKA